jgi:hypothetical protein
MIDHPCIMGVETGDGSRMAHRSVGFLLVLSRSYSSSVGCKVRPVVGDVFAESVTGKIRGNLMTIEQDAEQTVR